MSVTDFKHRAFQLSYPADWHLMNESETVISLKKNALPVSLNDPVNPNLRIFEYDSAASYAAGIHSLSDFAEYMRTGPEEDVELEEIGEIREVRIGNKAALGFRIIDESGQITFRQQIIFFSNLHNYYMIVTTDALDQPDPELQRILRTIVIPSYEPLEKTLSTD